MKKIILCMALLSSAAFCRAQKLAGIVKTSDNVPVSGVQLRFTGTKLGTVSDSMGRFHFDSLSAGTYSLVLSGKNYVKMLKTVVVGNHSQSLSLLAEPTTAELDKVFVSGSRYSAADVGSSYAAKLPLRNLENPQVVSSVGRELVEQQVLTDFSGVLTNLPGVVKSWSSTNPYYISRGFVTRSYYRNGLACYAQSELDPANLEQMEALKGPSGTLFGGALASFGGVFNRITKKPYAGTGLEVGFLGGNWGFSRFALDANTMLAKDSSLLFRVSIAKSKMGSFQDQGFSNSFFVAPGFLYRVNERLSISLDAEFYQRNATSQPQISVSGDLSGLTRYYDYKKSYSNNTVRLDNPFSALYGQVSYQLPGGWLSQTNIVHTQGDNTGNYLTFTLLKDSLLTRNVTQYPVTTDVVNQIQQNFMGDFLLGSHRNRIVLGLDLYSKENTAGTIRLGTFDTLNLGRQTASYGALNEVSLAALAATKTATFTSNQQYDYSIYFSDVFNVLDHLLAMASVRMDRYDYRGAYSPATGIRTGAYRQTSWSPKFGLVYQLVPDRIAFFANYMSGFQNVYGFDADNVAFRPQYANQWEAGVKMELPGRLMTATFSYYDIRVRNTLIADTGNTGYQIQKGTQYSKGFEADMQSAPFTGLSITAGYTLNLSKVTNADANTDRLRPSNAGPQNMANGWFAYRMPASLLPGFGIGFGINYSGKNLVSNSVSGGAHYMDAYTLLKGGCFYERRKYRFSLNMENLTDRHYFNVGYGIVTPGQLRRVVCAILLRL